MITSGPESNLAACNVTKSLLWVLHVFFFGDLFVEQTMSELLVPNHVSLIFVALEMTSAFCWKLCQNLNLLLVMFCALCIS
jgi:hypothetical protein